MLTLVTNADIWTMDAAMPRAAAALIESNGRFAYVGDEAGARLLLGGRRCEVLDAGGCTVWPGLNDSHLHVAGCALGARCVDLAGAHSIAQVQARLRAGLAQAVSGDGWLHATGWNQEDFAEGRMLTRADLDAVSQEVPVFAARACGHIAVANSRALEIVGLADAYEDGMLHEGEQDAVAARMPQATADAVVDAVQSLEGALLARGITSVQPDDLGSVPPGAAERYYRGLIASQASGRFRVRYAAQALNGDLDGLRDFLDAGLHRLSGPRFRVAHIKLLLDGSLGARTAWLRQPYADQADEIGVPTFTDDALQALVKQACAAGVPVAMHAIGDAAMAQALDALKACGGEMRHAIIHAQILSREQLAVCGQMGITLMVQPIFLRADVKMLPARIGPDRMQSAYRWRTMLGMGAHVAFGTDCPVEPFDPMANLYRAITRRAEVGSDPYLPEEGFSMEEAVYAYTAAGAYASGEEADKGCIRRGMWADCVLLDRRLDPDAPEMLLKTKVLKTLIAGETVWSA